MSKADELLKKAAFFEKLSLYSDRKAFLQAIAQEIATPFTAQYGADAMRQLNSVLSDLGALGIKDPAIVNPLMEARDSFTAFDKQKMISALRLASSQYPQTAPGQLEVLKSLVEKLGGYLPDDYGKGPKLTTWQDMKTPEPAVRQPISQTIEHSKRYAPIDRTDQQAVFNFAVAQGGLPPNPAAQKIDGDLGPETRKALEAVKDYFAKARPQNPRMTDQQAITAAKFQGR